MSQEKFLLPNIIPIERQSLGQLINKVTEYRGICRAKLHTAERLYKSNVNSLKLQHVKTNPISKSEWLATQDEEFTTYGIELENIEKEYARSEGMLAEVLHHQETLRQDKALERVKIEKGIYDIT
tara:strand:+ start:2251 stop:2625 length:375 start_codon:yes stop_codon:yes gene_type:complete